MSVGQAGASIAASTQQVFAKQTKVLKRKGSPKLKHIGAYVGAFLLIVTLVALGYQPPQPINGSLANASPVAVIGEEAIQTSTDDIVANTIAGDLSERANLPIAPNVAERSVTLAVKDELAQTDETAITKPQIVQPTAGSREIRTYTTKAGDTAPAVAAQFGITATTLKWANNLTSDALDAGKQLSVPPVDGVIYTAKAGDTVDSLAARYSIDKDQIIAYNDLELGGLTVGKKLILAGANLPETERPGYVAPRSSTVRYSGSYGNTGYAAGSVGNKYAWGWCTWYAYERRAKMGRPIGSFWGNANSWTYSALRSGFRVDNEPQAGDVFQTTSGWAGHVGVIDSVDYQNGTVTYSDMNGIGGFGRVYTETIGLGDAKARWQFIH